MQPESFAHQQSIPASHKNVPEYLKYTQKFVKNFFNVFRLSKNVQQIFILMAFWLIPALL